jgi:hypothetical protein
MRKENMSGSNGNWLGTLGSWLVKPLHFILRPWWEKLVEEKAASAAVQQQVLEIITQFRVTDFYRAAHRDEQDRVLGVATRALAHVRAVADTTAKKPVVSGEMVRTIEREVELCAVDLSAWVKLACLKSFGAFDPSHFIQVEFTDPTGGRSLGFSIIGSLSSCFPFTQIIAVSEEGASVSDAATSLLEAFCSRNSLPSVSYAVSKEAPRPGTLSIADNRRLPAGWSPNAEVAPK